MAWAPNPPNFYKQFTKENVARLDELRKAQGRDHMSPLNLPTELRYLVPPSPPADDGVYRLFGQPRTTRDFLATLDEQGIRQLYPQTSDNDTSSDWTLDRGYHLKTLTRSIMLSFLELVGILSLRPAESQRKQEEIKTMYLNALHLINEYRPHQARESLILRMEDDIETGRREIESVKALKERLEKMIAEHDGIMAMEDVIDDLPNGVNRVNGGSNGVHVVDDKKDDPETRDLETQTAIWDVLSREFPWQQTAT